MEFEVSAKAAGKATVAAATPNTTGAPAATPAVATPAAKKFCSQCGKELAPGAKFCANCGTKTE